MTDESNTEKVEPKMSATKANGAGSVSAVAMAIVTLVFFFVGPALGLVPPDQEQAQSAFTIVLTTIITTVIAYIAGFVGAYFPTNKPLSSHAWPIIVVIGVALMVGACVGNVTSITDRYCLLSTAEERASLRELLGLDPGIELVCPLDEALYEVEGGGVSLTSD